MIFFLSTLITWYYHQVSIITKGNIVLVTTYFL